MERIIKVSKILIKRHVWYVCGNTITSSPCGSVVVVSTGVLDLHPDPILYAPKGSRNSISLPQRLYLATVCAVVLKV